MTSTVSEFRAGGRVLAGAVLGIGTGVSGLLLYTNGLFVAGLNADFGLTRTEFGFGILMVTIALAIANPLVGWAIDRFGARLVAAVGLVALAAGFAALGTLTQSVGSYIAIQTLMAFFAAASGPIAYTKLVSGWFSRHRGLALGITLTGIGLAAAIMPPFVARMIEAEGWRSGFLLLATIALAGLIPVWLLLREPPDEAISHVERGPKTSTQPVISDPFRSRAFWTMIAAFSLMAFAFAGLLPHFVPLLIDSGVTPVRAAGFAGLIGVAVITSRLVIGFLLDRFFAAWVAIGVCFVAITGCAVLLLAGASGAVVAALAIGCAMGGEVDVISFLVARYFGREKFGSIYGWQYSAFILGSGFGPLWIGALYDRTGNYSSSLIVCIILLVVACSVLTLLPKYPPIEQAQG